MPHATPPQSNLQRLSLAPPLPARLQPLTALTWRHRAQIRLMVRGSTDVGLLQFVERRVRVPKEPSQKVGKRGRATHHYVLGPPPAPGEPLDATEAGRLVGFRKRYALAVTEHALFQKALAEERTAFAREARGRKAQPAMPEEGRDEE